MEVIESWIDHHGRIYAVVKYSEKEQKKYKSHMYEALWMGEITEKNPEMGSFAGTVGYRTAEFKTIEETRDFLLRGISEVDSNSDIWLEMLEV